MEREHPEARSAPSSARSGIRAAQAVAQLDMDTPMPRVPASPPVGTKRLTANLPEDAADALEKTAASTGFNKVTTLVRAIRVFSDLIEASTRGAEVVIKEPDGSASRLILR